MSSQSVRSPQPQKALTPSPLAAFLTWSCVLLLSALAIFELKGPDALPATAPSTEFSAQRALAHVRAIAAVPHPIGSSANALARDYILAQLSALGMNPQVVTATGIHYRFGTLSAGIAHNVVARLPGTGNSGAVMLMAHYDSVPSGPGAGDDAAGVAAVLETVRALKAGSPLKNDLIVLLTDGEEVGLLGAEAFASSHPWLKDVSLVMNFEGRGNSGPSLLFETSANNASLIREVANASSFPIGSSLFYSLYKLLPNDTDLTVFRSTRIAGLNFAFGGRLEAYHSGLDTSDNLDTKSLQHHGSYALSLSRRFGQMDLTQFKEARGDDIFFDWFGSHLIAYSQHWVLINEIVVSILLVIVIVSGVRRTEVRLKHLVLAVLGCFVMLLIIGGVMAAAGELLLLLLAGRILVGDTSANSFMVIGLVVLGSAAGSVVLARFRRNFNLQELSFAGLVLACILSWTIALLLPAGSYLLFWPLLLTTLGLLILGLLKAGSPDAQLLGTLPGTVAAVLLFAPLAYLLYVFLTLNLLSIVAIGLLVGFFFTICVPTVNMATPRPLKPVIALLLAIAGVCLAVGIAQSHISAQHPGRDSLIYSVNTDNHTAAWVSRDRKLDAYTAQFLPGGALKQQPMPDFLAGLQRPVLSGPAPVIALLPPAVEIQTYEQEGDLQHVRMNVKSQRGANRISLRFEPGVKLIWANVFGHAVPSESNSASSLILHGIDSNGVNLEFTANAHSSISFWLADYSAGLPTTKQRPPDLMANQGSDETVACRKYTLGNQAK
ncbi:MAG TPA: M20/M25/M40 family metallo-hydrolase [Candidatus Angelobacter sp.]|nr:M20/M25/M40 family metallo-hydrolase [Candidatus Angelobacter sp.]